jgi:hypothetical protein
MRTLLCTLGFHKESILYRTIEVGPVLGGTLVIELHKCNRCGVPLPRVATIEPDLAPTEEHNELEK